METNRPPRILTRRYAALIGALTLLAHAVVNAIHDRQMRSEVRNSVRAFASPELARQQINVEKGFVRKADLAPITREIRDVHQEVNQQGKQLARMEGYMKAQLDLQRMRLHAGLPGTHLEASAWEPRRPSRKF